MDIELQEVLLIVAELTERYTSKESTSVSYDKARQLMEAVLYCIRENEQEVDETDTSIAVLQQLSTRELYQQGYQKVLDKVVRAKHLYELISKQFQSYGNQNYEETVKKGMPEFFKRYDARFCPQNHILTLDYPTLRTVAPACGIDAIYDYLRYIRLEQRFLSTFPELYVREVLATYHPEYEHLYCNLCNLVLRNVLGCMIARKKVAQEGFSEEQLKTIRVFVSGKGKEELQQELKKVLQTLIEQAFSGNQELFFYLEADIPDFAVELQNVCEYNNLEAIFVR